MKSFLIVTALVLVACGIGGMLTAPASTDALTLVYDVPAPEQPAQLPIPANADATSALSTLVSLTRFGSAGGCNGGACGMAERKVERRVTTERTVETSRESAEGRKHIVGGVVKGGAKVAAKGVGLARGVLGHERRSARRAAR